MEASIISLSPWEKVAMRVETTLNQEVGNKKKTL